MSFNFHEMDPSELHDLIHSMDPQELRDFLHWIERTVELEAVWKLAKHSKPWQLDPRVTETLRRIMEATWWCEMNVDIDRPDEDRWFSRDTVLKVAGEVSSSDNKLTAQEAKTRFKKIRDLDFRQIAARDGIATVPYTTDASREFRELVRLGYLVSETKRGRNGGYRVAEVLGQNRANPDDPTEDDDHTN